MSRGERIKRLREQNGLTQSELAEKIGTTKQTIYKYEIGIVEEIPLGRIEKIANAFGVSPSYIAGWDDIKHQAPSDFGDGSGMMGLSESDMR